MKLIEKRKDSKDAILKGLFIKRELQEEAREILVSQTGIMARRGIQSNDFYANRKYSVQDTVLRYDHLAKHRFVDMRRRNTNSGSKPKKNHPIHNRILFGHANNIIKRLSFGYTQAVIEEMKELENQLNQAKS